MYSSNNKKHTHTTEETSLLRYEDEKALYTVRETSSIVIVTTKIEKVSKWVTFYNNMIWFISIFCLFIALVFVITYIINAQPRYNTITIPQGSRVTLQSIKYNRFVRIDGKSMSMSESQPWLHGSTFEVYTADSDCFHLKTMSNKWLSVDSATKEVLASEEEQHDATLFSAVFYDSPVDVSHLSGRSYGLQRHSTSQAVQLKVCDRNEWLQAKSVSASPTDPSHRLVVSDVYEDDSAVTAPVPLQTAAAWLNLGGVKTFCLHLLQLIAHVAPPPPSSSSNSTAATGSLAQSTVSSLVFSLALVSPVRGVNLGSWFIPEVWMAPDFFAGANLSNSGSLCG